MIKVQPHGDKYLNLNDKQIWAFTYDVLSKFNCQIQFKVFEPDVTIRQNKSVHFFVPKGRKDVSAYISQEFEGRLKEPKTIGKDWMWGTEVRIYEFGGVHSYITRENTEKMTQNIQAQLNKPPQEKQSESANQMAFFRKIALVFFFGYIGLNIFHILLTVLGVLVVGADIEVVKTVGLFVTLLYSFDLARHMRSPSVDGALNKLSGFKPK